MERIFTHPRNRGRLISSLQFVCVSVCVCVSGTSCEQNSSWTDAPIWTRFSLNGCFPYKLRPYWIWWSWVNLMICHIDIPLVDLCSNLIKLEWEMRSLWRHLSFLQTIVHISNSIEPTNFVLGTNTQQYNVHLIIKLKVTLTDDEGHRRRSKVTKMI